MAMTEQELVTALAESGRAVTPRTLGEWRSSGLLPRLASKSKGLRKGKMCFWLDDAIFDRAALVHDLLKESTEKQEVYWLLWLCGYPVPLPQLRRAWAYRAKATASWKCNGHPSSEEARIRLAVPAHTSSPGRLLSTVLDACTCFSDDNEPEIDMLVSIFGETISRSGQTRRELRAQRAYLLQLKSLWFALKSSDLPAVATDNEMLEAQKFTSQAMRLIGQRRGDTSCEKIGALPAPISEVKSLGTSLFLLILGLIRSRRQIVLDDIFGTEPAGPTSNMQLGRLLG